MSKFLDAITQSYSHEGSVLELGRGMLDGAVNSEAIVQIPLRNLNRHGLITGATGTGKTKTVQILAEQLSRQGVPTLLMDLKGDMSGLAKASDGHVKIDERHTILNMPFTPMDTPVEMLTISNGVGAKMRSTLIEFGPLLFSKILSLNETQTGVVSVIYKYCDDNSLPLIDLKDFKEVLRFLQGENKKKFEQLYGKISPATTSTILRKVIELESQGADTFLGEPSFDVNDLLELKDGKGIAHILRLTDIQSKPKLFSTFMLSLLAEVYSTFPEVGDSDKPKLCLFIDEAHLVFEDANDVLIDQLEQIVRLIRSKGVGIFFCTQSPTDVPQSILSQLGLKIQHSLRAFTAKDRKDIKHVAANFPLSPFYKVDQLITELGIGEALISALDKKGRPSELVHTMLRAPESRMGILTDTELDETIKGSALAPKYNQEIDKKSAFELLRSDLIEDDDSKQSPEDQEDFEEAESEGFFSRLCESTLIRQVARTATREITRGLMGALGLKSTRRKSRRRKRY